MLCRDQSGSKYSRKLRVRMSSSLLVICFLLSGIIIIILSISCYLIYLKEMSLTLDPTASKFFLAKGLSDPKFKKEAVKLVDRVSCLFLLHITSAYLTGTDYTI